MPHEPQDPLISRISVALPWMVVVVAFVMFAIIALVYLVPDQEHAMLIAALVGLPTLLITGMLALLKLDLTVLHTNMKATQEVITETKHEINSRMDELLKAAYGRGVADQREKIAQEAKQKLVDENKK